MANKINDWQDLVDTANKNIAKYGKEIAVIQDVNNGLYSIDILTIERGETKAIARFAEYYSEDELPEVINDAWANVRECAKFDEEHAEYFCYRKVHGWTHGDPALIHSLTEFTLYFRDDETGGIEIVENSVDDYEDRVGSFCILNENYEAAYRQIEDHDKRI